MFFAFCWLAAAAAFAVLEAATVSLVSIWFAAGAAAAMFAALAHAGFLLQLGIFAVVSAVTFALTRSLAKRLQSRPPVPTNADSFVGRQATVTADILPGQPGRARLGDVEWKAECIMPLPAGSIAVITAVNATTLTLAPAGERQ